MDWLHIFTCLKNSSSIINTWRWKCNQMPKKCQIFGRFCFLILLNDLHCNKKYKISICMITKAFLISAVYSFMYHLIFKVYWFVTGYLWTMANYVTSWKSIFHADNIFSSNCWIYKAYILFSLYDCLIYRCMIGQKHVIKFKIACFEAFIQSVNHAIIC